MILPASFSAALRDQPPAIDTLRRQREQSADFRPAYAAFAASEQEVREAMALNHGSVSFIDAAVGRVMAQLERLGLDANTVVLMTSDHGDLLGDRGLMFKGGLHYPSITRVPLIWRDTEGRRQTGLREDLTQTIDIAPTVLARAGLPPVNGMHGCNLLDGHSGRSGLLIEEESQRADFGLDRRLRMRSWRQPPLDDLRRPKLGRTLRPQGRSARAAQPVVGSGLAVCARRFDRTTAARYVGSHRQQPLSGRIGLSRRPRHDGIYRSSTSRWLLQPETHTIMTVLVACSAGVKTISRWST
jgi:hypothetical protein